MQTGWQRVERVEIAIDANAHAQSVALRFDVDITRARAHGLFDEVVDEFDDGIVTDHAPQLVGVGHALAVDLGLQQALDQPFDA